jgi:hypothetical protein
LAAAAARAEGLLTREQKREYGIGWLNWLGADSIGVVVALFNIVWVPVVAFANIAVPDRILTHSDHCRLHRFGRPFRRALPAARAGVARPDARRGVAPPWRCNGRWRGRSARRVKERVPFLRTAKGGTTRKGPISRRSGRP